ncbi:MAG: threonine synthase, partial [Clostridia bacterium]|nr:threonine synthase [Clostridia bacterium]
YNSTRSGSYECTSSQAIKTGLSPDGGLFVPENFPKVSLSEIDSMKNKSYAKRAADIMKMYLTDFTEEEIEDCVNSAYNREKFGTNSITPVYKLNNNVYFLELWHGVTCAFKDVALQILPHFMTKAVKKTNDNRTVIILVATSGDTGKAALEGFKDVSGTKIAVFYPNDGVSDMQKLQMVTQEGSNVAVGGILGNFDDAQNGVKAIFTDENFKEELDKKGYMLSSANSINWGRLLPQIVYYFSSYSDMLKSGEIKLGDKINFVVPTGNFGDILAGYYAEKMGLPVNKLICASNENNVLTEFINTGIYNKNRDFHVTSSPSMDILISSNLERFLYDVADGDCKKIKEYMSELLSSGKYEVTDKMKEKIQNILWGGCCDDKDTLLTIKDTFENYGYIMDTHTAVGKNVYDQYLFETGDMTKSVILSTASPYKFNRSVMKALCKEQGFDDKSEFDLTDILCKKTGLAIPKSLKELKSKEIRFKDSIKKEDLKEFICNKLLS